MKTAASHLSPAPVPEREFLEVLAKYAVHFPYGAFKLAASDVGDFSFLIPSERSLVRFLPSKARWTLPELFAFEGDEFVYAVTRSLAARAPTVDELAHFSTAEPFSKLVFILQLNEENRLSGRDTSIVGAEDVDLRWRFTRWIGAQQIPFFSRRAKNYFRRYASTAVAKATSDSFHQLLLYRCLDKIDALSVGLEDRTKSVKRIVIANFSPIWPPMNGGQRRIFFLARELAKTFEVEVVTLDRSSMNRTLQLGPNLREIRVAASSGYRNLEQRLETKVKMSADLAYTLYWQHCSAYQEVLKERLKGCSIAVSAHPFSYYAIQAGMQDRAIPVIYDSQNCEVDEKGSVFADFPEGLQAVRDVEATALRQSQLTIACAPSDAQSFASHYGIDPDTIEIVENGVDAIGVPPLPDHYAVEIRKRLGIMDELITVFGGSFYFPNFQAVDTILELARLLPRVTFIVLGRVCEYPPLQSTSLPNVIRLGPVDEDVKWLAYNLADIGLNPMTEGSGTAVKMFEYAAASLTILTTPWGTRGIPLTAPTDLIVSDPEGWSAILAQYGDMPRSQRRTLGKRARDKIERYADWSVIGKKYDGICRGIVARQGGGVGTETQVVQ